MRYDIHVPSGRELKVSAAKETVTEHFKALPTEISIDSMSLPENGKRAKQPMAIFGYRGIRRAAKVRIGQIEQQLGTYTTQPDVRELIIAQESGLKININPFVWLTQGITREATVAVIQDRRTKKQAFGISCGVRVRLGDIQAIMNDDLSVWHEVIAQTLKRQGRIETVNDIDWYQQYDPKNPSRAACVKEATRRAVYKL